MQPYNTPSATLVVLALLAGGCAGSLAERDWSPRTLPASCRVDVTTRNGRQQYQTVRYYDDKGRIRSGTTRPTGDGLAWENFTYDDAGRLTQIVSHEQRRARAGKCDVIGGCSEPALRAIDAVRLRYDKDGRLVHWWHERTEYRQKQGRYEHSQTRTRELNYSYDSAGRLIEIDAPHARSTLLYKAGRLVARRFRPRNYPERTFTATYAGGKVAEIDVKAHRYRYQYDAQGRVSRRDTLGYPAYSEQYVSWGYDERGRLARLERVNTYKATGQRSQLVVELAYDASDRVREQRNNGELRVNYQYSGACTISRPPAMGALIDLTGHCLRSPHGLFDTCPSRAY